MRGSGLLIGLGGIALAVAATRRGTSAGGPPAEDDRRRATIGLALSSFAAGAAFAYLAVGK